jgi:hypothetical protein
VLRSSLSPPSFQLVLPPRVNSHLVPPESCLDMSLKRPYIPVILI